MRLDWLNPIYSCLAFWGVHRIPDVVSFLQIQPEIGGVSENFCQNQCRVNRDRSFVVAQFVDRFSAYHHCLCKVVLGNPQRLQELRDEHFSNRYWLLFCCNHIGFLIYGCGCRDTRLPLLHGRCPNGRSAATGH